MRAILEDQQGNLWFGTGDGSGGGGVSRYDSQHFKTFTAADGLAHNEVWSILEDRQGNLWFGTWSGGVSRYDGQHFKTFATQDDLAHNRVMSILEDREGKLWFGTYGGGLSRYDGLVFQTLSARDGLVHNGVQKLIQARNGDIWIATEGGVSRYRPSKFPPAIRLVDVVADHPYGPAEEASLPSSQNFLAFKFQGRSFTTHWAQLAYVYKLEGYDQDWRTTRENQVEYTDLPRGDYLFQVKTVDRDLNYSAPAQVKVTIHPPYGQLGWMSALSLAVVLIVWQTGRLVQRDRKIREANKTLAAHARQLTRQTAVDRVRAETATMRASVDLEQITPLIWKELTELGVPFFRCGVFIVDEEQACVRAYLTNLQGASLAAFSLGFDSHAHISRIVEHWQAREVHVEQWDQQEFLRWMEFLQEQGSLIESQRFLDRAAPPESLVVHHVPFAQGTLYVGSVSPLSAEDVILVQDLASAFSMAYARYLDFQRLEEQNRQIQEANRAKSLFLANMSHEIRTPMNAILGYAQLLQRRVDLPTAARRAVETIQKSGDHLLKLINEVLDLSKIEAGRMELHPIDFDLKSLVETLGVMFQVRCQEKGLTWKLEGVDSSPLRVHGDEAKLNQVLMNLLSNAVKFTQEGEVVLRVVSQAEAQYRFEVSDTGVGIAPAEVEKLFQPFQQGEAGVQAGGTGLGLAIARRQVELMGGQLTADSKVGQGSRFSFALTLPPARGKVQEEGTERWTQVQRLAAGYALQALVADDVAENRDILRSILIDIGVEVEVAENGQQALERLEVRLPDIAFLDVRMPVLDGLGALRQIRERSAWNAVKVVAISASVLEHERQEYLASGFDAFIPKPFRFAQICACLAELLGVEYEYAEATLGGEIQDWSDVALPADLLARLRRAAELYSVTELEECLREMEQVGEESARLAARLRNLRQQHDIEGILAILRKTQPAS